MGKGRSDGKQQPASARKRGKPLRNQRAADPDDFAPFATWDGDEFGQVYGDSADEQDSRRATVVIPAITLPSVPAVPRPPDDEFDEFDQFEDDWQRAPILDDRANLPALSDAGQRKVALPPVSKKPQVPEGINIVLVPGSEPVRNGMRFRVRSLGNSLVGPLHVVRTHRKALTIFALAMILVGVVANTTGLLSSAGLMARGQWNALASFGGPAPTPTPIPAPDFTNPGHYVAKYGFDYPSSHNASALGGSEWSRLVFMLPYAYKAASAYDRRYHQSIEPEMLVWWTHSEGIRGRISYSNCANNPPLAGYNYFNNIQNCPHASFWQLGYGNQFSVIYVLKNAFRDMHGDPNDPKLVQKVGQWVLNYDRSQGTYPPCGGYSCTFPARTIDSIMSGIDTTTGVETADNWWASVLSRDPAINCYMIAHALTYFNHQATARWIGCYYAEPCWGYESNKLGDVLAAWPALRRAAHI
ncbi:MAG: hypothetical protein ACM3N4_09660 [Nitrososphaerota archaeon]